MSARRRVVDEPVLLLLLQGIWSRVEVGSLPNARVTEEIVDGKTRRHATTEWRYDLKLRKSISRAAADLRECKRLDGSDTLYAVSKRQLFDWHRGIEGGTPATAENLFRFARIRVL
jgi:hypothetical protein